MKKKSWGLLALLIAFAVALGFGAYQAAQVGDHLQYFVAPPPLEEAAATPSNDPDAPAVTVQPNRALRTWQEALRASADEWENAISAWTMGGVMQSAAVSTEDGNSTDARVELLGENAFAVTPRFLRHGRLFFDDELESGAKVMLLDEQIALKLFSVGDPIDRLVRLGGVEYRVVGILRHDKRVGDYTDAGVCVPLMSLLDQPVQPDAIQVEAAPVSGAGANVAFSEVITQWQPGGTIIDLGKESMAATLWLRVLLFLVGFTLTLRLIRWLNRRVKAYAARYRTELQSTYAVRLMPQLVGAVALFTLGYAAVGGALALLMNFLIEPIYTFPEWIPTVLVEWEDIAAAFWNVWQKSATLREFRSPELLRLRYFTLLIQGCSAASGVILALWYGRVRSREERLQDSLTVLFQSHVAVSFVRTDREPLFASMGYVPCPNSEEAPQVRVKGRRRPRSTVAMLRVISAESVLRLMPNSAREGSFVLAITDDQISENNETYRITCAAEGKTVERVDRDYDLRLPVQTLTRLVYGEVKFQDYLESHADYDLKMRSPAMEGFFAHHLAVEAQAY